MLESVYKGEHSEVLYLYALILLKENPSPVTWLTIFFALISMIIMCFILTSELLIDPIHEFKQRLTWPYGDMVSGAYLAKVTLPVFCTLTVLAIATYRCTKLRVITVTLTFLCLFFTYFR